MDDDLLGLHDSLVEGLTSDQTLAQHPDLQPNRFLGDPSVKSYGKKAGYLYADAMRNKGLPQEQIEKVQPHIEESARTAAKNYMIRSMGGSADLRARQLTGWVPLFGHLAKGEDKEQSKHARELMDRGEASAEHYQRVADDMRREEESKTTLGATAEMAGGLAQFAGDYALGGGAGMAAGRGVVGRLLGHGASAMGQIGLRQAIPGAALALAGTAVGGVGATLAMPQRWALDEDRGKAFYHSFVENSLMPGLAGIFSPGEHANRAVRIVGKTIAGLMAGEATGLATEGTAPFKELALAVESGDPQRIAQAKTQVAASALTMVLFEGAMNWSKRGLSEKAASEKLIDQLRQRQTPAAEPPEAPPSPEQASTPPEAPPATPNAPQGQPEATKATPPAEPWGTIPRDTALEPSQHAQATYDTLVRSGVKPEKALAMARSLDPSLKEWQPRKKSEQPAPEAKEAPAAPAEPPAASAPPVKPPGWESVGPSDSEVGKVPADAALGLPNGMHAHPSQNKVPEHAAGWLLGEDAHWQTYPEKIGDAEVAEAAKREPAKMPPGGEGVEELQGAWDLISRLWPEGAARVKQVKVADLPARFRGAVNTDGVLVVPKGRPMPPSTLWHELVHLEQHEQGRSKPVRERSEAEHLEVEREAYSRQGQMATRGIFDKLREATSPLGKLTPEEEAATAKGIDDQIARGMNSHMTGTEEPKESPEPTLTQRMIARGRANTGQAVAPAVPQPADRGMQGPVRPADALAERGRDIEHGLIPSREELLADGLTDREALVVSQRLNDETLDAVGKRMGLTRERARQIEADAMKKMNLTQSLDKFSRSQRAENARRMVDEAHEKIQGHVQPLTEADDLGKPVRANALSEAMRQEKNLNDFLARFEATKKAQGGKLTIEQEEAFDRESNQLAKEAGDWTQTLPEPSEQPAPVRPETGGVQRGAATNAPAAAGAPTQGNAGPQPPTGPVASPGDKLTFAIRGNRGKFEKKHPEIFQAARAAGLSTDDLHANAEAQFKQDQQDAAVKNEIRQKAIQALANRGMNVTGHRRTETSEHLSDIARNVIGEEAIMPFREVGENDPEQVLDRLLREPKPVATMEAAYDKAQATMVEQKQKAVEDAIAKAKADEVRRGLSPSRIEEAVSSGEEAGAAKEPIEDVLRPLSDEAEGHGPGAADLSNVPFRRTGVPAGERGPLPGIGELGSKLYGAAKGIIDDQMRMGAVAPGTQAVWSMMDHLQDGFKHISQKSRELFGQMFPKVHDASRLAGEALSRMVAAPTYVRLRVPEMIDKVLGPQATPAERHVYGTAFQEMRQRYADQNLRREAANEMNKAAAARAAGDKAAAARAAQNATDYMKTANNIKSLVGATNSPIADETAYQTVVQSPEFKGMLDRWKQHMVPEMEDNFRKSQWIDEDDPIRSLTQMPGLPINLKAMRGEEDSPTTVKIGQSRGNLKNLAIGKNPFANQVGFNAEKYDTDLGAIIENSLTKGTRAARKAEMYRQAAADGLVQWGERNQKIDGFQELPFTTPPRGTQEAEAGQVAYARDDVYSEIRKALGVDAPRTFGPATSVLNAVSRGALISTAEATYHAKNLLTMMAKPGMSPAKLIENAIGVIRGNEELASRVVDLAKIGAMKDSGFESQMGWAAQALKPMGKFLDIVDKTMRLTADDAFQKLKDKGLAVDTEQNRRDFVNQLGQYNKRAQSEVVSLLRDTGVGPFATAGTNYYAQGLKAIIGEHGLRTTGWKADLRLRAEMLGRIASVLAVAGLTNYLRWGKVDGDENTPLGAVKLWTTEDGKVMYFDLTGLTGLTRGMRSIGALALMEGYRSGQPEHTRNTRAYQEALGSPFHPAMGPGVQTAWTLITGKDTLGRKIAEEPGGPKEMMIAALKTANPSIAALSGAARPNSSMGERISSLAGPFGVKFREGIPTEVRNLYDTMHEVGAKYQSQLKDSKRIGEKLPMPQDLHIMRQASATISKLEVASNRPGTTPDQKQEIRERQRVIAARALEVQKRFEANRQILSPPR